MTSAITTQAFTVRMHAQNHIKEIIEFVNKCLAPNGVPHSSVRHWVNFLNSFGHQSPESLANGLLEIVSALEYEFGRQAFCGWEMPDFAENPSNPQLELWNGSKEKPEPISLVDGLALSLMYFFAGWPRETIEWQAQKPSRKALLEAVEQWYYNAPPTAQRWMH